MTLDPLFTDEGIPLAIMGMLVVFATLVLVSIFIAYLPRVMDAYAALYPDEKALAGAEKVRRDELTDETVAVIAAAAMQVVGPGRRIVHITTGAPSDEAWAFEGRRQHHASHIPHSTKPKS